MVKCSFCGKTVPESKGKMVVKLTGQVLYFCKAKCEKNWKMGRDPKKLKWTTLYVKGVKGKDKTEEKKEK